MAELTGEQLSSLYGLSAEEGARLAPYTKYVDPEPYTARDWAFGWFDGSLKKKDYNFIQALRSYDLEASQSQSAREYEAMREDTKYQRMMEDMRKAGISPYANMAANSEAVDYHPISARKESSKKDSGDISSQLGKIVTSAVMIALALM